MNVDKTGNAEALAALSLDVISTRDCVAVTLSDGTVKRFIIDTIPITLGDDTYVEVPAAEISPISLGSGALADSATINLDGAAFTTSDDTGSDQLLIALMSTPLRDRPIQISTMVLNDVTAAAIGLIPIYVGFVDETFLDRSKREDGSIWTLRAASYRAFARRRPQRLAAHNDHIQRWPSDGLLKHLANTVFTNGVARWNSSTGSSSGGGSFTNGGLFTSGGSMRQ